MFNAVKYYSWGGLSSKHDETYEHLKLPYEKTGASTERVLFVLDGVPGEDLLKTNTKLLSGDTGHLLQMLVTRASANAGQKSFSWMAFTYNAYRTVGKSKEFISAARDEFSARLQKMVAQYKPTKIICFGSDPFFALAPKALDLTKGNFCKWLGVPVKVGFKHASIPVTGCLSLRYLTDGSAASAGILGYLIRTITNGLNGELRYSVDVKTLAKHKSKYIDSIKKFDALMDMLEQHTGAVSVDTEAANLNRRANKILTIQFATSISEAWTVPLLHKDTPFDGEELKYIIKRLRAYFEHNNKNDYHIYSNAQFDLNLMRSQFKIRFFHNDLWDIFAGEFGLDENLKFLGTVMPQAYYHSLGNLSMQYGCEEYERAKFSKEQRATISNVDLTEDVLWYMTLDVVVPFAIHLEQKKRGKAEKHAKYESLVRNQLSDMIHGFSVMESTGSLLDVDYLFYLRTSNSPIEKAILDFQSRLEASPGAKKANARLVNDSGRPSSSLYSVAAPKAFDITKQDHQRVLFFDVLELEPLSKGTSGHGKLDKHFQKAYASVPEVKMFTELGKAKKLRNAYVKSFIKKLRNSADLRLDKRIRATYNYLKIVTNRSSASDPNLQQIPARSEMGKLIKRLFIAPPGHLYIKVDYRVHEVRGWGIISFDKAIAEVFEAAKKLRDSYRMKPNPELAKRLKTEADIHVMNAAYFFGLNLDTIDKDELKGFRNAVKGVIFGLIYQMAVKTLAGTLGKPLEFTENLVKNFRKRFPRGMRWIEEAKEFARKHFYYENPFGFRRHLWGYLLPAAISCARKVHADMDRRSVNSPVQGMCSEMMSIGIRYLDRRLFELFRKTKRKVDYNICNSVHDSLENTFAYEDFLLGINYVEHALTDGVKQSVKERHGLDFVVDLEVDFEIGSALSNTEGWDFSIAQLEQLVFESLRFQRDELHYEVDVVDAMETIFSKMDTDAPAWMRKQAKNSGWKFDRKKWLKADRAANDEQKKAA